MYKFARCQCYLRFLGFMHRRLFVSLRFQFSKSQKPNSSGVGLLVCWVLAMTYFRTGMTALSSAQRRFTVLFGMGRGGSNALWSPRIWWLCVLHSCNTSNGMGGRSKEMIRLLRAFVYNAGLFQVLVLPSKQSSFAGCLA